jgi:hypothetical protein
MPHRPFCDPDMEHFFLCIGCLESRLGRTLIDDDFREVPLNEPGPWHTLRLLERLYAKISFPVRRAEAS